MKLEDLYEDEFELYENDSIYDLLRKVTSEQDQLEAEQRKDGRSELEFFHTYLRYRIGIAANLVSEGARAEQDPAKRNLILIGLRSMGLSRKETVHVSMRKSLLAYHQTVSVPIYTAKKRFKEEMATVDQSLLPDDINQLLRVYSLLIAELELLFPPQFFDLTDHEEDLRNS